MLLDGEIDSEVNAPRGAQLSLAIRKWGTGGKVSAHRSRMSKQVPQACLRFSAEPSEGLVQPSEQIPNLCEKSRHIDRKSLVGALVRTEERLVLKVVFGRQMKH